ncbi:MAG: DNA polymerase III subunit delta' [Anaerolineae bacterium]|jgi:DNA polymerase-3 subunit delta'
MLKDWRIVGHEWAVRLLQQALERDELSHAYLFTGPPNVGKETVAAALARALLCEAEAGRPCDNCRGCHLLSSGNHPDLHHVEPDTAAGRVLIAQVRELSRQLSLTPSLGQYRVAILSDFHRATPSAANALLKTLEEPPPYVVLVLLAPDTDSLLPTIVSRCQVVPFQPVSATKVEQALIERWGVDAEQAQLLAHVSGGRLGWAVTAATDPDALAARARRLEELDHLIHASLVERFRYAENLAHDPEAIQRTLDVWTGLWRDVMVVAAGAEGPLTNLDLTARIRRLARALGMGQAAALVRATRRAADLIRRNANPRLTLEVLIAFDLPRL